MIVHQLTVVGHDDVMASVQSNKCPSPLFPPHPSRTTAQPPFHFSQQPVHSCRPEWRTRPPRICDGIYREIGQAAASSAKTSKGAEAGFQERCWFLPPSFKYFAQQEKEEEAAGNEGGSGLLAEQIWRQGFREAIFCPTSSAKSSIQNPPTSTCACRSSSLHCPCFPRWL